MNKDGNYIIPPNYSPKGMLMGRDIRNYIEIAIIAFVLGGFVLLLPIPSKFKIYGLIIFVLPALIMAWLGVNGVSLFTFVTMFFKYRNSTKEYGKPTSEDRIKRRKQLLKKQKQKELEKKKKKLLETKSLKSISRKEKQYAKQRRKAR